MSDTPPPSDPGDPRDPRPAGQNPPPGPDDAPTTSMNPPGDDEAARLGAEPPPSGAQYPGPPPGVWPVQPGAPQGRFRRLAGRARGSRLALAIVGIVVAAGLVLGGIAVDHEVGGDGGRRDERGASAQRGDDGNGNGRFGGQGERGGRDRDAADDNNRGNGNNAGNAPGRGQQVLGTISALSSTSITVRTSGGTPSYPITANTPVTRGSSAAAVSNLKVGDAVVLRVQIASAGAAPVVVSIAAS